MPGSVRQWTLVALVKKTDILPLRLFEDNWRTGASRLQHDVTCVVGSCHSDIVFFYPIELYWITTIEEYFYMGCVTFRSPVLSSICFECLINLWKIFPVHNIQLLACQEVNSCVVTEFFDCVLLATYIAFQPLCLRMVITVTVDYLFVCHLKTLDINPTYVN
jgi:hypothetical protein